MASWGAVAEGNGAAERPGPDAVRVLLVDDQPLARAGCRTALEVDPGLLVVGEAADGRSAIALAASRRPHVVVVHDRVPGIDALRLTRAIRADGRLAETRVVTFAAPGSRGGVVGALRAGVDGVLSPGAQADELRRAVSAVAAGGAFLSPVVARDVIAEVTARGEPSPAWRERLSALTERERQVVAAVARGLSNEGIGSLLHMSPATARTHVSRALIKLGLRDRGQLVVLAYESGLVSPGALAPDAHPVYTGQWATT